MTCDVSVIVAAWNAETTVAATIESALSQSGVSVEVIVADDCSTDRTVQIVRGVNDPRVSLLQTLANAGPSHARNLAIGAATGRWIAILDSDDRLLPGRLKWMIHLAESKDLDIIADNLIFDRGDESPSMLMFPVRSDGAIIISAADYIRSNCLMGSRYNQGFLKPMFRRAFLEKHAIQYDENIQLGEDYLLVLEALLLGAKFAFDTRPGYLYKVNPLSITSQRFSNERIKAIIDGDERLLHRFTLKHREVYAQQARMDSLKEALGYALMAESLKERSIAKFKKGFMASPWSVRHFYKPATARLSRLIGRRDPNMYSFIRKISKAPLTIWNSLGVHQDTLVLTAVILLALKH
jgi:succinoglycan biosynthesis protein ExoO